MEGKVYELWFHTPTRTYVPKQESTWKECEKYMQEHKNDVKEWGYYFTIRLNGTAVARFDVANIK